MTNAEYQEHRRADETSLLHEVSNLIGKYMRDMGCDAQSAVRDVLTDLRHYCDLEGLDFGVIDSSAYDGYAEECTDPPEGV